MFFAPVFEAAKASSEVVTSLGNPPRLYPFGEAPPKVAKPYAVCRNVGGRPENYLTNTPDIDNFIIQVDVYGASDVSVHAAAKALVEAFETLANVTRWNGEGRDPETKNYTFSFTLDWFVNR